MNRALRIASVALIAAGVTILLDVGLTLVWKEPVSAVYGSIKQSEAEDSLAGLSDRFGAGAGLQALDEAALRRRAAVLAPRYARTAALGDGIGRIEIPDIGLDMVFVQGADESSLEKGPGHYIETPFPGEGGTVGIAGHRTTYLAPFRHIDEIDDGDRVVLEMPYGTFTYTVTGHRVVDAGDVEVFDRAARERLVLTACHPLYSAAHRWVVFADLTEVGPPPA